jgi:hypothetical protein
VAIAEPTKILPRKKLVVLAATDVRGSENRKAAMIRAIAIAPRAMKRREVLILFSAIEF